MMSDHEPLDENKAELSLGSYIRVSRYNPVRPWFYHDTLGQSIFLFHSAYSKVHLEVLIHCLF